jgi:hypothetical protein
MNSLTDLREVVDVIIGVDTHVHTHSAAVLDAATGGVLGEINVETTPEGYDPRRRKTMKEDVFAGQGPFSGTQRVGVAHAD